MKSKNLINLFKDGNITIPMYFLKNIKKFNLENNEFIFLMYLYNLGNEFLFDPGKYSNDLNIELVEVMTLISSLTDKQLLRVEVRVNEKNIKDEIVVLDDFYNKICSFMVEDVNVDKNDEVKNSSSEIFQFIEREFGRTISGTELEIIRSWLERYYSEELIKEAVKEAVINGVSNFRYIDKILYQWEKDGINTVKDVEERRKNRKRVNTMEDENIDLDVIDGNWLEWDE